VKKEILHLSFEDALRELDEIVEKLENAEIPLEEGIKCHEHADQLRQHCEKKLNAAKLKIEKILTDVDGEATGTEEVEDMDLFTN